MNGGLRRLTSMHSVTMRFTVLAGALIAGGSMFLGIMPSKASTETGPAQFLRNHEEALAIAKKKGKPVFAFFQEVPG